MPRLCDTPPSRTTAATFRVSPGRLRSRGSIRPRLAAPSEAAGRFVAPRAVLRRREAPRSKTPSPAPVGNAHRRHGPADPPGVARWKGRGRGRGRVHAPDYRADETPRTPP